METSIVRLRARPARREQGQRLAKYALILGVISVVAMTALVSFGASVITFLSTIGVRI